MEKQFLGKKRITLDDFENKDAEKSKLSKSKHKEEEVKTETKTKKKLVDYMSDSDSSSSDSFNIRKSKKKNTDKDEKISKSEVKEKDAGNTHKHEFITDKNEEELISSDSDSEVIHPDAKQSKKRKASIFKELKSKTNNPYTNNPFSSKYYEILNKRKTLPAWEAKEELFEILENNQVMVLKGETGSGKTTQIPQFLLEKFSSIAVTQPRRVAAMSVARRVAEEMDVSLGQQVGYSIRFEDCCSNNTILKYLTDGMLLKEAMTDRNLSRYDLIILDECHERTLATEILFGLFKEILPFRKDLKLVVMSATIDIKKFKEFFNAPVLSIPGRLHHVEVEYLKEACPDYLEEAIYTAVDIHQTKEEGDILIFLCGEEEIETACARIKEEIDEDEHGYVNVIPLYSTLPPYMQQKIFDPTPQRNKKGKPGRKIICSTNIAETSVTIDGIVYVIDCGYSKQKVYNPRLRMESLLVSPISQASAKQRAGRAGRTREGICKRLYTLDAFHQLEKTCYPEILRSNLSTVVLTLLKLGVTDIVHFDFMDPPAPETMMRALEQLHYMNAINEEGELTEEGVIMAHTPLDPELAKVLISAKEYKCINEILTIVSMLSVPGVFLRPRNMKSSADDAKKKFTHSSGDHITLLTAFNSYKLNNENEGFCKKNYLNSKNLKNAINVRNQLEKMLVNHGIIAPANDYSVEFSDNKVSRIFKTLLNGCFAQVCHLELAGYYLTVKENQMVLMHPSTVLSYKPSWVLYHDFVCTGKNYIRTLSKINPEWLFEVAPYFYNVAEFPSGRIKRELTKILSKINSEDENVKEVEKEEIEERKNIKLKEINEDLVNQKSAYSKYNAISKYKITKN